MSDQPGIGTAPPATEICGSAPLPPPPPISDHELLRCIGRGSYGGVWLARNALGLHRAVKVVHLAAFRERRPFERELAGIRRFEPISRSHDGFLDILHVGTGPDCFYYLMELADDLETGTETDPDRYIPRTLAAEIRTRGRRCVEDCLQFGLNLSAALHHLHCHGLVHRDVKPSNIVFVGGRPKLADVGLVADMSGSFSYVGTEGFIPPEGPGTAQADVYGLGKVLYEMSTGRDRNDFPELPRDLAEFSERTRFLELNQIIMQACHGEKRCRYATAWQLHADLLVLANGRSVRRLKMLEVQVVRLRRAALSGLTVLLVGGAATFQVSREIRLAGEARQREVGAAVARGAELVNRGDYLGALLPHAQALSLHRQDRHRTEDHRLRLATLLDQSPALVAMWNSPPRSDQAHFSPDGRHLLVSSYFGRAQVFSLTTGLPIGQPFGQVRGVIRAAWSPDGRHIVTTSPDATAAVWSMADGELLLSLPHPDRVFTAVFSPDGEQILTTCRDGVARLWSSRTREQLHELVGHGDAVVHAAFSPDGRLIATASQDRTVRLWDAAAGTAMEPVLSHETWVGYVAFHPDGRRLVTAAFDHAARIWDVDSGRKLVPDMQHADAVTSAEFSPDGRMVLTASLDGEARLWHSETAQALHPHPAFRHPHRLMHASFDPSGRRLATACLDGTTRLWDLAGTSLRVRQREGEFSGDGSRFAVVTGQQVRVHDTVSASAVSPEIPPDGVVRGITLSRDGRFLLVRSDSTSGSQTTAQLWDVATGRRVGEPFECGSNADWWLISDDGRYVAIVVGTTVDVREVTGPRRRVRSLSHALAVTGVQFSPDGRHLLTRSGKHAQVWRLEDGTSVFDPLEHPLDVSCATFSPGGDLVATGWLDSQLTECAARIWSVATGSPVTPPLPHRDGILSLAFSPDGGRLLTTSEDFTTRVWDVATGKPLTPPLPHPNQVLDAAFSPDGRWLATVCSDRTARMWNVATGEPLSPPLPAAHLLRHVAFLGDGAWLLARTRRGMAWLWEIAPDRRSPEYLRALSQILAGRQEIELAKGAIATPHAAWQQLREQQPGDFTVTRDDINWWHQRQFDLSRRERNDAAMRFHLEQLRLISPQDTRDQP